MTANATDTTGERLILRSSLPDLARIPPWLERLAAQYAIPDGAQFAMDVCLEEVLSNVIRHGYAGQPDRPILVQFSSPREGYFVFVVDDEAPPFDPLAATSCLSCTRSRRRASAAMAFGSCASLPARSNIN